MKGYTLIELLVIVAAVSIIGWGLYNVVAGGCGCPTIPGHGMESIVR